MRKFRLFSCCLFVLLANVWGLAAKEQPNVIIIYGDDVGFGDLGVNGATMIPTPNIDQLAKEGINFTDGHCTAATCTPSRFSLLTGIHAFRYNARILPPDAPLLIPQDKLTLPGMFKRAGYTTAVIGKWHLGIGEKGVRTDWNADVKPGPLEIGFDYSFLLPSTNDRVPCVYLENHRVVNLDPKDPLYVGGYKKELVEGKGNTQYPDAEIDRSAMTYYQSTHGHDHSVINGIGRIGYQSGGKSALWNDETISDVFVEQFKKYIDQQDGDQPFFLYFASQNIHVPRAPNPRFRNMSQLGYRGDAMVEFDWCVGEIMKTLKEKGLDENTIVIFSSDNGPVYDDGYDDGTTLKPRTGDVDRGHDGSGIWRGGKYQIAEGGTRVPLIIRWPAQIEPRESNAMVSQVDFMASFAALLDVDLALDEGMDSRDTLSTFLGNDESGLDFMVEEANDLALRLGDWKYAQPTRSGYGKSGKHVSEALYNLSVDPMEQTNLAGKYPERAAEMKKRLEDIMNSQGIRSL